MAKRKLVIDEKESSVLMGVMAEGCDPVIRTVEGTLEKALDDIPKLLADAETEWGKSPKRPAYKAPPEPKKETKKEATQPAAGKTTEELPLLSGTEPAPVKAEVPTEVKAEVPTEVMAEAVAEDKVPQVEVEVTPAPEQPPAVEPAPVVPGPEAQTPSPAPAATPAAPAGQWQYWLEDGRGPFSTVQEAMDAKGLDKDTRPQHNRWDRLSTELKKAILRKPKAG